MKKTDKPSFNDLAQPNMSKEAKALMEYAMQRSCDEQVKSLVDWEADTGYEFGKCNKTPEEIAQFIVDNYGDALRRLSKT